MNVTTQQDTVIASTGLSGDSNGMAIDASNRYLVFRTGETGSLRSYDLATNTLTTITGASLPGSTASAAFYNGSYYFQNNTNNLFKVDVNLASSAITGVTNLTPASNNIPSLGFGDIEMTSSGILYGSSSNQGFISLALANLAMSYTALRALTTLQIALTPDDSGLYAHNQANLGQWSTLTLGGGATPIVGFQTTPLRDLADHLVAVPEPSSIVLASLGGAALLANSLLRPKQRETTPDV